MNHEDRANRAIEEARRAGFDLDLLDLNLELPPAERWKQHHSALVSVCELENARKKRDARLHQTARTAR